jgi:hypothetical protein
MALNELLPNMRCPTRVNSSDQRGFIVPGTYHFGNSYLDVKGNPIYWINVGTRKD